ncbi:MAG: MFS transporter [Pseudomonadota bacterium]
MGQILPQRFIDMVLPAIFRDAGLALEDFWVFSLASAPYWFKWLWAPYIDHIGSPRIGRRKSIIIPCTLIGAAVYSVLALAEPSDGWVWGVVGVLFLAAFVMSVQDVAVDGYTLEGLNTKEFGSASAIFSVGARFADILSVGGLLVMYEFFGWEATMITAACLLILFSLPAFIRKEPPPPPLKQAMIDRKVRPSLTQFIRRKETPYVLGLVIALTFALFFTPVMVASFMRDLGFRWVEIALAIGLTQTLGAVVGGFVGTWILSRFDFQHAAIIAAGLSVFSPLGYIALSTYEAPTLNAVLLSTIAFIIFYSPLFVVQSAARYRWVSKSQAGTDFTIQSSCFFLGLNAALACAGFVAGTYGWTVFFTASSVVFLIVGGVFALSVGHVNAMADKRESQLQQVYGKNAPGS